MREHKYKVWDMKLKSMRIVDSIDFGLGNGYGVVRYREDNRDTTHRGVFKAPNKKSINCILLQYTGLKDKKGKEIYEGDILKYIDPWGRKEVDYTKGYVIFGKGNYSIHCQGVNGKESYWGWLIKDIFSVKPLQEINTLEIIGNIYENPELLNGKN